VDALKNVSNPSTGYGADTGDIFDDFGPSSKSKAGVEDNKVEEKVEIDIDNS